MAFNGISMIDRFHGSAEVIRPSLYLRFSKPLLDRLLVVLSLPVILPLIALIALAVRLGSPGPTFLRLTCKGMGGWTFRQWRFRCVYVDAAARQFRGTAVGGADPRLTPIGAVLLSSQLNLLPQIFNVLMGDMALVGPQAEPATAEGTDSDVSRILTRMRPGLFSPDLLTDDETLSGRDRQGIMLAYVAEAGFFTDLRVMISAMARLFAGQRTV